MHKIQHYIKVLISSVVFCLTFLVFSNINAQTISSFTPLNGKIGTSVTITGSGFSGTTGAASVKFGGTNAQSYTVNSNTQITAVVGAGTSGNVTVTNGGTATLSGFTYVTTPTITNLAYTGVISSYSSGTTLTAPIGGTVTFTATQFGTTGNPLLSSVIIGGVAADLSTVVYSAGTFTITVPSTATTGTNNVSITNIAGTSATKNFTLIPAPTITSYSTNGTTTPISTISAGTGTTIIVNGTNFAGNDNVTIGGTAVTSFPYRSSTKIYVVVPANAASGNVVVTNNGGSATFGGFTYIPNPTITSYSTFGTITPISTITAATGNQIIINGTDFSGTNLGTATVKVGGVSVSTLTINSATKITATVPANASGTSVTVTNNGGTAAFSGFTYIPTPTITSFSTFGTVTPLSTISAATGTQIILNGTNFSGTNLGSATITMGGVSVITYTVNSSTTITATVPANAASGSVVVTNNGGSASKTGFTYFPTPTITSYSVNGTVTPVSTITAATGTTIIINGTNFSGTDDVTIGGVTVTSITYRTTSIIYAVVPANAASGNVVVTNSGGSATFGGFIYIPTPTITSYSTFGTSTPISTINGAIGTQIIINGTDFSGTNLGATSVRIGGAIVSTFTVNSSTKITATVPSGSASGSVVVTNNGGSATISGFTFVSAPTITSFSYNGSGNISTLTAPIGATVTFNGSQFGTPINPLLSGIKFGGVAANLGTLSTNSSTLTVVIPSGAVSGNITATNIAGTVTKISAFTLIPPPIITSFTSPVLTGDLITLTGTNLSNATSVTFGGVASSFTNVSSTTITATVPTGVRGNVSLIATNPGGTTSGNTITINNSWSGVSSNDWGTAANWNTGFVPSTEDVVIPIGLSTYPALSTNVSVGKITLNGTLSLNGHTLTILTSLSGSGSLVSTSISSLDMEGSGTLYFDASNNNIKNLTINNTVTLGNALNLYGVLYPNSGTLTTGGSLTLKSISGGQGVVAAVGGTINGTVVTERYIPKNTSFRAFRDLTPIVANAGSIFNNWQEGGGNNNGYGVQITGISGPWDMVDPIKGFDVSKTGNGSLQTNTGTWTYATNTKTMNLDPSQGYRVLIRGNRSYSLFTTPQPVGMNSDATLRTTGNLITGTVSYKTSGTTSTSGFSSSHALNSGTGVFNFIGNPFACTVSWSSVLSHSVGINPEYYYLDPTFVDGSGNQSYVTYNATSGTNSNPSSHVGNDIQPGQAFFVKNDGTTSPQVIFQEIDKTAGNTPLSIFGNAVSANKLSLQLYKNNTPIDGAVAIFKSGFTKSVGSEDSKKIMNTGESLTFSEAGGQLCIEGTNLPTTTDTLNIQLSKMIVNTNYQLKLNANLFNGNGVNAYILDKYTKVQTLVNSDTTTISFTTKTDSASYFNRFSIIFRAVGNSLFGTTISSAKESINLTTALKSNDLVEVNFSTVNATNSASYILQRSANGSDFSNIKSVPASTSANYSLTDANASIGINYYRIKAVDQAGVVTFSSNSKLIVGKTSEGLIVYPNPVTNKNFTVQLNNFTIGNYTITVYNNSGQRLVTQKGVHTVGSLFESINLGDRYLPSGIFIVKVASADGHSYEKEITIK